MMKGTVRGVIGVLLAAMMVPAAAQAQQRMPAEQTIAVGGEFGVFIAGDPYDIGPTIAGLIEFYVTPRVSIRGTLGWADPDLDGRGDQGVSQTRLALNLLYNWEEGAWHPFVTAGFGAHFLQRHRDDDSIGDSETEAAFNLGAGIEYFTGRTVSLKGETLYHVTGDAPGIPDPSGLTLTIGLKKYF
jgi:hypothetical protein